MGYFFFRGAAAPAREVGLLVAASGLLYTAAMALNDVCDISADNRRRPTRPLPSGRRPPRCAASLDPASLACGVGVRSHHL